MNYGLDKSFFAMAFMKLTDFYHRSKHSDITSLPAPWLGNSITIASKNRMDAVRIPF